MIINDILIPLFVLIIIVMGVIKKIDVYNSFVEGCIEGLSLVVKIIPPYFAMIFAINIFVESGIITFIVNKLSFLPVTIKTIAPIALIRPISGTAALALLNTILDQYGPDSLIGLIASTIQGCTDTTFYVLALYFSSVKIKKTKYALLVGLLADLTGVITAIIVVNLLLN